MRKILTIIMIMLLCATALAETPATPIHFCGDYVYILLDDGSAQIVSWDGDAKALTVPPTLDGYTVTSVSECAFADCPGLQSIILPDTVLDIGQQAFVDCVSLMRVSLPQNLQALGGMAFDGCEGLTRIALPATLEDVGDNPFRRCANLYDIAVSGENAALYTCGGALFSKADSRLICLPMGIDATNYAVPEGTRTIGAMAFDRDICLQQVTLPQTLISIGARAFDGCNALRTMNLPASVTSIGAYAMRCKNLTLTVEGDARVVWAADIAGDVA